LSSLWTHIRDVMYKENEGSPFPLQVPSMPHLFLIGEC
nr:hypothetical protein [Tanacetum cinerariifolium]